MALKLQQFKDFGRRQVKEPLAVIAVAVAVFFLLTMSLVTGGQVSPEQAAEIRFAREAAKIAELGLSVTIMEVRKNPDWRTDHTEGTWVNRKPFGGGSFSVVVQDGVDADGDGKINDDEGDGNLADEAEDLVTLWCWGEFEGIVHFVGGVVQPSPFKVHPVDRPR